MNHKVLAGAISGALAVALGAFGAHGLKTTLGDDLATWQTASHYHVVHSLAWFAAAYWGLKWPSRLFAAGIVLFSGSLYLLAALKLRFMGAVAPLGGVCFILGWLAMALPVKKKEDLS